MSQQRIRSAPQAKCAEIHPLICQLSLDTASAFEEELIDGFAKVCHQACVAVFVLRCFSVHFNWNLQKFVCRVLDERTRSVAAPGTAHHRARMTSSALRFSAGELHIMHKHELSLSQ